MLFFPNLFRSSLSELYTYLLFLNNLEVPEGLGGLVKTQHLFIKQSGLPIESLSCLLSPLSLYIHITTFIHKMSSRTKYLILYVTEE